MMLSAEQRLVLRGRYDASHAADFARQLDTLIDAGAQRIILDFSEVAYISSSILRVLVLAHRKISALQGDLVLVNVPPRVMRVFHLVGLDRVLHFESFSP